MTIDFDDKEQFQKFVYAIAQTIVLDPDLGDELEDDVAAAIMGYHIDRLTDRVFDKLIERAIKLKE